MKKKFLLACLISAVFAAPAGAWELWDQFKATNLTPEGRVVDYSEAKLTTTSEGQSYGMFQRNGQDPGYQQRDRLGHVDCLLFDRSGPHLE